MLAEKTIRKHVSILHAYSLMSVLQRKIVNVLLYEAMKVNNQINHHDSVAVECHIPFSNLCKAIKFNSNNTQYLKESIDGLASLKIEWNLLKDKVPTDISFLNLRVLHGAPTFYQDNTLNFSFHKVMLALVENPSIYGTLDIDLQSDFESKYGHALYENSTRFVNLQKNKIIEIETFRKILGVQDSKYQSMRELARNVIKPSVEEVNDRANFFVSLQTVKSGRKVIGFEVAVKNKQKAIQTESPLVECKNKMLQAEIKKAFGSISESILENILNKYPEEYILEKIIYTQKYSKKEGSGFYPIPYFVSAIKHDYKSKEESQFENLQEKIIDPQQAWKTKLHLLQLDLRHWEGRLMLAKNEALIKINEGVVLQCQEKIKQHYLEQQTLEEVV